MFSGVRRALERALAQRVFPAVVVEVGTSTRPLWAEAMGRLTFDADAAAASEETIFDLASLTKVLATTPLVMQRIEQGTLGLDDRVADHVDSWRGADREAVTVRDLLSHSAGLAAHRPFYETLAGRSAFERAICEEPLEYPPGSKAMYSDLGFMLLGFILGSNADLAVRFSTLLSQMAVAEPLQFNPPPQWKRRLAPTALDAWRGRLLVGEVDDQNAAALGGVAGHAGLFGTAAAVGACARHLMQVFDGRTGVFTRDTARLFVTRRSDVPGSSRALGWDTMLPGSSCGSRMSPRAFGHTGFTGTSLWIDPDEEIYVVLLTNRVHPDRKDRGIQAVRREVHDAVMASLQDELD
jgi:CubicO group peptidase (beta-lactamase class C family)